VILPLPEEWSIRVIHPVGRREEVISRPLRVCGEFLSSVELLGTRTAEMHLALAEGDYEFIGSTGAQPSVQGVAWVSDA
ncbi:hypothetical protein LCGC14_1239250, partial [marine sediment metagenome]